MNWTTVLAVLVIVILAGVFMVLKDHPADSPVGRYQMVSTNGANVFLLDTKTGRLWMKFVRKEEGPTNWDEQQAPWIETKPGTAAK